jgi:hypothetical protein
MAYHNMCMKLLPLPGVDSLLGLGHKFCIQLTHPKSNIQHAIFRFIRQVHLQYWRTHDPVALNPTTGDDYIPNLYIKLKWNPPHIQEGNTKFVIMRFVNQIEALAAATKQRRRSNLIPQQHHLIRAIKAA